jgi:hypothetical protein
VAVEVEDFRSAGRLFHRGSLRHNSVEEGTSEIGSSAKVGPVAVG